MLLHETTGDAREPSIPPQATMQYPVRQTLRRGPKHPTRYEEQPVTRTPIEVVGAVIVGDDGLVLAAQRSASMSQPGRWEFPGGKVEPGETPQQALARELDEELDCRVDIGARVATTTHADAAVTVRLTTFLCTLRGGMPRRREHSALRWMPAAELDTLHWAPADVPAMRKVMRTAMQQCARRRATREGCDHMPQ